MTHHNITGSEVGRRHPPVYMAQIRRRGRPVLQSVHVGVWMHLAAVAGGIILGLIDALLIGKPYTIGLAILALVAWRFWPTR